MTERGFSDLRTAYLVGEQVIVTDLPKGTEGVFVRTAIGATFQVSMTTGSATIDNLPEGTHSLESRSADSTLLAEELFSVRHHLGDDPIMGFVTSFNPAAQPSVLKWLHELRCTVVQVYDWMESYSSPLPRSNSYVDPLGRPIERSVLKELILNIRGIGAVAQAYAPVCAADGEFSEEHSEWRLFRNDGVPQSLGNLLQIMDPASIGWQQHWIKSYGEAVDTLGFNGMHLDTYGYPRNALSPSGEPVSVTESYEDFIHAVREARPRDVLSFNQVNGVPRGLEPPSLPGFRYIEVWPPNDQWRHFEGLLERSAGGGLRQGDTLAIYPPVWNGDRESALRTAVLSEAVTTTLGANTLIWGDDDGVLCHPYYVNHEQLREGEISEVLQWHRFGLRCRDLFLRDTDTSWYELNDENASVMVSWGGPTSPEPIGGALFVRVIRGDDVVVVSLLDLSGSADGSWTSDTGAGTCTQAEVSILVDSPERWRSDVAVLGGDDERFARIHTSVTSMREGNGLSCSVDIIGGWSVLRITRGEST